MPIRQTTASPGLGPGQALLRKAVRWLDRGPALQARPFDQAGLMRPNIDKRLFSVSHYGIMIPNLPEPFRFFR